jgi:hypothetical protein
VSWLESCSTRGLSIAAGDFFTNFFENGETTRKICGFGNP